MSKKILLNMDKLKLVRNNLACSIQHMIGKTVLLATSQQGIQVLGQPTSM